jgi:hypothetical protein
MADRRLLENENQCGQATKGIWWMPWRQEAMKDVKAAISHGELPKSIDPWISEWGNPPGEKARYPHLNP